MSSTLARLIRKWQIAIESAQYLKRKYPNVEVTVRDLEGVEGTVVIPPQPPQVRQ